MKNFIIGLILGLVIGILIIFLPLIRYEFKTDAGAAVIYKIDRLTGEAWGSYGGQGWQKIINE